MLIIKIKVVNHDEGVDGAVKVMRRLTIVSARSPALIIRFLFNAPATGARDVNFWACSLKFFEPIS